MQGQDFGGKERRIGSAGLADGERADGNSPGHLDDREQGIDAVEHRCGNRNAEHGKERLGGEHSRQMGRAPGAGDDDLQAAALGLFGILEEPVRRAMGRDNTHFVGNRKFVEQVDGSLQYFIIALAAHDDADERVRIHPVIIWTHLPLGDGLPRQVLRQMIRLLTSVLRVCRRWHPGPWPPRTGRP